MLKKFFKEYSYVVVTLLLLEVAGTVIIFLGAFTDIPAIGKCFLLIMGVACIVSAVAAWVISLYEFEKLEMLIQIKDELVKEEN